MGARVYESASDARAQCIWCAQRLGQPAPHISLPRCSLVDVFVFGCQHTLAFMNMLVIMTYNPGLMMGVVAGEMLGVAVFEPPSLKHPELDCH